MKKHYCCFHLSFYRLGQKLKTAHPLNWVEESALPLVASVHRVSKIGELVQRKGFTQEQA